MTAQAEQIRVRRVRLRGCALAAGVDPERVDEIVDAMISDKLIAEMQASAELAVESREEGK